MPKASELEVKQRIQYALEQLPLLPEDMLPKDMLEQIRLPPEKRYGFRHSNGEWNFVYKYNKTIYRLPESVAVARMNAAFGWDYKKF